MADERASFTEIEHTADLAVEITAGTLPALFAAAGEALSALIVDAERIRPTNEVRLSASGGDPEELLHAWLCELLAQFNIDGFIARTCTVDQLTADRVEGRLRGEKLNLARHGFRTEIKGVTYHDFKVWEQEGAWHARIIFDV